MGVKLRSQIIVLVILLFVMSVFFIAYFNFALLKDTSDSLTYYKTEKLAQDLSATIKSVYQYHKPSRDKYLWSLEDSLRFKDNIRFCQLLDARGMQFYHFPPQAALSYSRASFEQVRNGAPVLKLRAYKDAGDWRGQDAAYLNLLDSTIPGYEYYYPVIVSNQFLGVIHLSLRIEKMPLVIKFILLGNFVLLFICIITAIIVISIWGSHAIVRPIKFLLDAQEKLGRGDFETQVQLSINPTNEILTIAASFNRMVGELKKIQGELKEKSENLEKLNFEYKTLNENLEGAVNKKTRELKEFFSLITHDLRVPLVAIQGYVNLLIKDPNLDERNKNFLKSILTATQHLLILVRNMLDTVKYEEGETHYFMENFNFPEMLQEVHSNLSLLLDEKHISFQALIPPACQWVYGDRTKIMRVFANLINNALDYTPNQGVIKVSAEDKEDVIRLTVFDNGEGMTSEHLAKVFEKYSYFSSSGSGLGLYIAKKIMEGHKQEIRVQSTPGEGTVFSLNLAKGVPG